MAQEAAGKRLAAILWFVAAAAAWIAVAIRYFRRDELTWTWAAAGALALVMGISALRRTRSAEAGPADRDRDMR
jgi:hypothetical protein